MPKKLKTKEEPYVITDRNYYSNSSQGFTIETSYSKLKSLFGEPHESDNYKVSGEWSFHQPGTKHCFAVYDWKSTNLYDIRYPSVEEFRKLPLHEFEISSSPDSDFVAFTRWLHLQCK